MAPARRSADLARFALGCCLVAHAAVSAKPPLCAIQQLQPVRPMPRRGERKAGARSNLEASHEKQDLTEGEMESASAELKGLFELFEDDDVLDLFEMDEPTDAAVARHDR
jgi:hypothetical protein